MRRPQSAFGCSSGDPAAISGYAGPVWAMATMITSVSLILANSFGTRLRGSSLPKLARWLARQDRLIRESDLEEAAARVCSG